MSDLRSIASALGGEVSGNQVLAPGPGHSPNDRSMSIKLDGDGFIVNSFANDGWQECRDYIRSKMNWPGFEPKRRNFRVIEGAAAKPRDKKIVAAYDYNDDAGELLYQVIRYEPKDFRQRRPDGNGGWIWNLDKRRVLYRWPELVKYPDATVFLCEGEKDADRVASLGHCATTVASGKWTDECIQALAGRDVIILEDNDDAGREKSIAAAQLLHGKAKAIRVVALPDLPEGEDVSDWLDADPARGEKLPDVCFDVREWSPGEADLTGAFAFVGEAPATPPRELIKKLLPADGVVITGGQSSAGKTFLDIHKAVCLATGLPFFGRKIVERVGTVFVAAEGRALLPNRFAAALKRIEVTEKLPIAWIRQLPDFSTAEGIKLFIRQLKEMDKRFQDSFSARLGQFSVDTIAASFGMKNEDDNAEATRVCNILRTIGEETATLAHAVHHYGKNPESGLRGASAFKGSAESILGVLADIDPLSGRASNRELVCAKARDGEQGPVSPFNLEFVELGLDEDDEAYGSCCVVPVDGQSRFDKAKVRSKGQRTVQDAINEVLDGKGKTITPRAGMASVKAAKVSDIREEFNHRYVVGEADPKKSADTKRMAFKRALDGLSVSEFGAGTAEGADWIWKIT